MSGADRGDGVAGAHECRRCRRERPPGGRGGRDDRVPEAFGGRDHQPGEDPGAREGGHADRREGRPFLRDAAEGNSGQGDSLLSLEAEGETIANSDEDAEGPTAGSSRSDETPHPDRASEDAQGRDAQAARLDP